MGAFGAWLVVVITLAICGLSLYVATNRTEGKVMKFFLLLVAIVAGVWGLLTLFALIF
jgi:hypothetical protein